MNSLRYSFLLALVVVTSTVVPCFAQDQQSSQAEPAISGTGAAGKIAVWKNSTTLTNSVISQSGGNVGIGTSAPVTKLEVNGNAQVDGTFSLSGVILENGVGQLLWAPNDGSGNFSVGLGALPSTTTGTQNTAVGAGALLQNLSGTYNTAIGTSALASLTGPYGGNTGIGAAALGNNTSGAGNTAVGLDAMFANTTGNVNTAVGSDAMYHNNTGAYNVAMGQYALANNTTGSYNIVIGYGAGTNIVNTSNNIDIGGDGGIGTDNGVIRIGCAADCTAIQTSAFIAGIYNSNVSGIPVVVNSYGQLGIASSSRRYKDEIHDMADASAGLMQLRPVTFRYTQAYEDGSKPVQFGLIAEEVEQVYPDLVARSADGQIESVRYQLLDSMLLNELQKQHATITAQKTQIESQQQHIQSLEERLARIEAMLAAGATGAAGH